MKFQVFKSSDEWYWHLLASNGKIIAAGEGYKRKAGAMKAVNALKKAGKAEIVLLS